MSHIDTLPFDEAVAAHVKVILRGETETYQGYADTHRYLLGTLHLLARAQTTKDLVIWAAYVVVEIGVLIAFASKHP